VVSMNLYTTRLYLAHGGGFCSQLCTPSGQLLRGGRIIVSWRLLAVFILRYGDCKLLTFPTILEGACKSLCLPR
jgi:hypothetical protein